MGKETNPAATKKELRMNASVVPLMRLVCSEFKRVGSCSNAACHHIHVASWFAEEFMRERMRWTNYQVIFCRYFSSGRCNLHKTCRFFHATGEEIRHIQREMCANKKLKQWDADVAERASKTMAQLLALEMRLGRK
jgi:hypothetical protein